MHDLLYREQSVWNKTPDPLVLFNAYAGIPRLDIDRFKKDMESEQAKARVKSDELQADALGVAITPTIFINNRKLPPYLRKSARFTHCDRFGNEEDFEIINEANVTF